MKVAKKRKSEGSKTKSGSSNSLSGSAGLSTIGTFGWVIIIIVLFVGLSLYYVNTRYGLVANVNTRHDVEDHNNLKELLSRAQALAMQYRNLTGTLPSDHNGVVEDVHAHLNLRRPDIMQLKTDGVVKSSSIGNTVVGVGTVTSGSTISEGESPIAKLSKGTSSDDKRDVMIGIAHDMDPKNFVVFCASFREVNTKAELIIFANSPVSKQNIKIAGDFDVTLLEYSMDNLEQYGGQREMAKYHPSTLRWPFIANYFSEQTVREQYSRVWMADVRDTYFQSDPFSMLGQRESGFLTFGGVDIMIAQCGWNGGWIKDCFGDEMLGRVGRNKVICSGVSMGDMESVYRYLQLMNDVISSKRQYSISSSAMFPHCERNGVDQGVHNVLVHTQSIPNLRILEQSDGPVANMQAKQGVVKNHQVFNRANELYAVVHQYDRDPDLQSYLFKKYVDWIDTSNPMAEWEQSDRCSKYKYEKDVDMFKGVCDLSLKGGVTGPASCCDVCDKTNGCRAFTFYQGTCYIKNCADANGHAKLVGALSGYIQ